MAVKTAAPPIRMSVPTRDDVIEYDPRTLTRDFIALAVLFLVIVGFHIQHPLLLNELQFGKAWRNETIQPAMVVTLAVLSALLIRGSAGWRRSPLMLGAAVILAAYSAYLLVAIVARWNLFGALLGIDQTVFVQRPNEGTPLIPLATLYTLTMPFELITLLAAVFLWRPWTRLGLYARSVRRQSAPLIVAVLVLVAWELLIIVFRVQEFLLPRPTVIFEALGEQYVRLISAGWNTFQNAFWGFIIGCGAGIFGGIVAARFTSFSSALLPVAIAINAIPIVALAPIFNNWFGALSPTSKIAIVAVLAFFPTMISTVKGLTTIDPLSLELMNSYAASNWHIFRKLRLPNSLPYIFSSLKIATTLSMIGAIVSEYFGGSTAGLGYRIRDDAGLFKYPEAWAAIFVASLFGIGFYLMVTALERALMSWHVSFRDNVS